MRLTYRFQQADPEKGYHFLLSSLIQEGMLQEDLITTNIKKIKGALEDCRYIIDRYEYEEVYVTNPDTNRQQLIDFKVVVYPTQQFQQEQYRLNAHHKNIENYRLTGEGKAVIKPMRDKYPSSYDYQQYQQDKEIFEQAKLTQSKTVVSSG
ncbi:MAG: hypothetical protein R3F02_12370 [Thiolinea sp.]